MLRLHYATVHTAMWMSQQNTSIQKLTSASFCWMSGSALPIQASLSLGLVSEIISTANWVNGALAWWPILQPPFMVSMWRCQIHAQFWRTFTCPLEPIHSFNLELSSILLNAKLIHWCYSWTAWVIILWWEWPLFNLKWCLVLPCWLTSMCLMEICWVPVLCQPW